MFFGHNVGQHVFASDSQVDLDEWTDAIQEAVHEDRLSRKAQKQKATKSKSTGSGVSNHSMSLSSAVRRTSKFPGLPNYCSNRREKKTKVPLE